MPGASVALRLPLTELHNPESGRLDAGRIAEFLRVHLSQVAAAVGHNYRSVYKTPDAASLQDRLFPFQRVLAILAEAIEEPAIIRAWLNIPLRELGDRTPLQVMLDGHPDVVADMLEDAMVGTPG
jgi:hypothetical protein